MPLPAEALKTIGFDNDIRIENGVGDAFKVRNLRLRLQADVGLVSKTNPRTFTSCGWEYAEGRIFQLGRPLGLLTNYSLHYVGGVPRHHISADYFGVFSDRIQQLLEADRLDPPFVGAMSNGTSGNINNIDYSRPRERREPYEQIRRVAEDCAQAVFQEYKTLTWHDWVPLGMRERELELAVRKPTPAQLEHVRKVLAEPQRPDKFPHERNYAAKAIQQLESPDTVRVILQAVRIGDSGIAAIPFEVFSETGLELKVRNPFQPSFTIELANGG